MDNVVALVWLIVIGSSIGVAVDAYSIKNRTGQAPGNTDPLAWALGCLLLWIIFFPVYIFKRSAASIPAASISPPQPPSPIRATRECPHCKEAMRRDASVCPHCRRDSQAWVFHSGTWWWQSEEGGWFWLKEPGGEWVPSTDEPESHSAGRPAQPATMQGVPPQSVGRTPDATDD